MQVSCPGCRSLLSIPEGLAGRTVRCQFCNQTLRAPAAEPLYARPAAPPPPRRPAQPPRSAERREDPPRRSFAALWLVIPFGFVALLGLGLIFGAVVYFAFGRSSASAPEETLLSVSDGALPRETLDRIKAMTVFVKVEAGALRGSGSGFLIRVDGDTGYVVTNDHVANPREDEERGPIGRRATRPNRGVTPRLSVVLASGTSAERTLSAQLVIADAERDLAILRVRGPNLPKPLDLTDHANLTETMPVYILGFPFGEKLGLDRNPSINVGRATVTSIRRDRANKPAIVQLQGELHPGNSGGPVVDSQGRLIGVAVAKLEGTQIGFAIAPTVLEDLLRRGR